MVGSSCYNFDGRSGEHSPAHAVVPMTNDPDERLDFGPGGYLPRRAAQRARKIVLREQMGLGWPLAAIAAALLVGLVGAVFLLTRSEAPAPPFVPVGPVDVARPAGAVVVPDATGSDLLVVRAGGALRVFEAPGVPVVYCPASRRLEAPGLVWNLRGRLVGGDGRSLRPLASLQHDGGLYVDPGSAGPVPEPDRAGETPACVD